MLLLCQSCINDVFGTLEKYLRNLCVLNKLQLLLFLRTNQIPISVQNISSAKHPVTVGVSDSFHIDHLQLFYGTCGYICFFLDFSVV